MPEVVRNLSIALLSGKLVAARSTDHFRNVRVRVKPLQLVAVLGQRVEELLVIEAAREREILLLARSRVEIEKRLVHAAVLDHLHPCPSLAVNRLQILFDPP